MTSGRDGGDETRDAAHQRRPVHMKKLPVPSFFCFFFCALRLRMCGGVCVSGLPAPESVCGSHRVSDQIIWASDNRDFHKAITDDWSGTVLCIYYDWGSSVWDVMNKITWCSSVPRVGVIWFCQCVYISLHQDCKWIHVGLTDCLTPLSSPRSPPRPTHGVRVHVQRAPPFLRNSGGSGRTPKDSHLENNEQQIWRVSNPKFVCSIRRRGVGFPCRGCRSTGRGGSLALMKAVACRCVSLNAWSCMLCVRL